MKPVSSPLRARAGPSPRIRGKYDPGGIITLTARAIPANTGRIISLARIARTTRDHPREYGENLAWVRCIWAVAGSSPRIRGEFHIPTLKQSPTRIIPANTGRICTPSAAVPEAADHPREYGENPAPAPGVGAGRWIIPANTGRMRMKAAGGGRAGDHPREYGENLPNDPRPKDNEGSSPRIRGESRTRTRGRCRPVDHPREYGENSTCPQLRGQGRGSSPRIRGECWIQRGQ